MTIAVASGVVALAGILLVAGIAAGVPGSEKITAPYFYGYTTLANGCDEYAFCGGLLVNYLYANATTGDAGANGQVNANVGEGVTLTMKAWFEQPIQKPTADTSDTFDFQWHLNWSVTIANLCEPTGGQGDASVMIQTAANVEDVNSSSWLSDGDVTHGVVNVNIPCPVFAWYESGGGDYGVKVKGQVVAGNEYIAYTYLEVYETAVAVGVDASVANGAASGVLQFINVNASLEL